MKKAKIVKQDKNKEINNNEEYSLKDMLKIILIVLIVFVAFYFITFFVVKPNNDNTQNNTSSDIDPTLITLNHLLDRDEDEYYVLAIKESLYASYTKQINYIQIYNKYISDYNNKEGSLTFYSINLDDSLNKSYLSDKTNITENLNELKLSDEALFKIKNGKIEESYVGSKSIINALSKI